MQDKLYEFFKNPKVIGPAILLSTIAIFLSGYNFKTNVFLYIDTFFTLFFLAEAIVKIRKRGFKDYWEMDWNKFDFIITIVALPSLLSFLESVNIQSNLVLSLRAIRVFKALRMIRSVRILRVIPNLDQMIKSIKMALKACFVVIIGFFVLMLITAIISSAMFGNIAPEFFSTPGQSVYTTFRIFTVEGWYEIPNLVAERSSAGMAVLIKIYFCALLFAGGIIGMSLINSLFVDAMAEDNNDEVMSKLRTMEKMMKEMQIQSKKLQKMEKIMKEMQEKLEEKDKTN